MVAAVKAVVAAVLGGRAAIVVVDLEVLVDLGVQAVLDRTDATAGRRWVRKAPLAELLVAARPASPDAMASVVALAAALAAVVLRVTGLASAAALVAAVLRAAAGDLRSRVAALVVLVVRVVVLVAAVLVAAPAGRALVVATVGDPSLAAIAVPAVHAPAAPRLPFMQPPAVADGMSR